MPTDAFTARFFDGEQIQAYCATVERKENALSIKIKKIDTDVELLWDWNKIQVMEPPFENRDIVLGYKDSQGARLVFKEKSHYDNIVKKIPPKNIKLSNVAHPWRKVMIMVAFTCIVLGTLLIGIPLASPFIAKNIPENWDDNLGQFIINQVASDEVECVSPEGKKALQKLVSKLSKASGEKFDVKVLTGKKEDINAFAVPGKHIIVLDGLIQFADSPDELAGVLAHEMGHAIKHHPTQGIIRQMGIMIVMTSSFGTSADYVTKLLNLKHSRADEQAADDIALLILNQANISPHGFAKFFEKMSAEHNLFGEHENWLAYFSSHPGLLERMHHIKAQPLPKNTVPSLSVQEWQDLKVICKQTDELIFK